MKANSYSIDSQDLGKCKRLSVGDKLYSEGSWNIIEVKIIEVVDNVAISDKEFKFSVDFIHGDTYIYRDLPFSLDCQYWILVGNS